MSLFCRHDFRPKDVARGENGLGDVSYAVAFYCVRCGKRRLDKGWSLAGAERQLRWLLEQKQTDDR